MSLQWPVTVTSGQGNSSILDAMRLAGVDENDADSGFRI